MIPILVIFGAIIFRHTGRKRLAGYRVVQYLYLPLRVNAKIMKISLPENIDINKIKTLLFDWGGVITPIDPEKTIAAFRNLGHPSIEDFFEPAMLYDIFYGMETGKVDPQEAWETINARMDPKIPHAELEAAYCRLLLDTPPVRISLLQKLKPHFHLCLLSNTNRVHVQYYNSILKEKYRTEFSSLFHKVFFSHELGNRKPGQEIFDQVFADPEMLKQETLFLDDTKTNIDMARSLGIQSVWINGELTIEKIFADWL